MDRHRTIVLITGCSSGIGLHLAVRLASDPSQGFKVYATLRDLKAQGPLLEAARARGCPPGSLETLELDVRDSESVAAAQARVTEGRVDVLVCNAGRGLFGPLEAYEQDAVGAVLDVNVVGTIRMLQAFLPDMKRRRSGRVLVTASVGGLMGERKGQSEGGAEQGEEAARPLQPCPPSLGLPFHEVYCASKFAVEGLCESLAILLPLFGVQSHGSVRTCCEGSAPFADLPLWSEGKPGITAPHWPPRLSPQPEPHRVRGSAHSLPREAGRRPRRGPGASRCPDASPLCALPGSLRASPEASAGPGGGGGGLPDRAASPAARAALLLHGPLPAAGSHAHGGRQRQQLRCLHAPGGLQRPHLRSGVCV
ncbi:17-beta-hydroxysteroid dehydrogenase type 1 isoform X1 [Psammomys obesus]|uniref:17-beta-hydroxysteroid dehydrogenase type 1 isoform X1 n=1 Tax=Psammomys obesus TaxID=48139 RepID=UPI0024536012|nr:17-beta-hydroxysteroid dehydrogenase type 1 isoform X1 [Psammomys obesus]